MEKELHTNITLPGIYNWEIPEQVVEFNISSIIHSFSEIEVSKNTLILCDIDDTVLHHPGINNSWVNMIHCFFLKQNLKNGKFDKIQAETATNQYLDMIFDTIPIRHTDRDGFFAMLEKAADFAFVTARGSVAKDFTYSNLRSLDIDPEKYPVHFCGSIEKGEYITQHFDLSTYDHVIFIDDQPRNLENVFLLVFHANLKLYEYRFILDESPDDYYPFPPGFNSKSVFVAHSVTAYL